MHAQHLKHHRSSRVGTIGALPRIGIVQLICRPDMPRTDLEDYPKWMHMFPQRDLFLCCLMFASFDNSTNDLWIADKTHAFYSKSEDLGGSHPMLPAAKPSTDGSSLDPT